MSGLFVTFEGGEGAGKSTQIRRLAAGLEAAGARVLLTREPGGSPLAETLRGLLLTPDAASGDPLTQALILAAARRDHVRRTIRPALAEGRIVLCDRFADSTRAYQGGALANEPLEATIALGSDGLVPDRTYLLDLDPAQGLGRARGRGRPEDESFERADLGFHQGVRRRFLDGARQAPERVIVFDAGVPVEALAEAIAADFARWRETR